MVLGYSFCLLDSASPLQDWLSVGHGLHFSPLWSLWCSAPLSSRLWASLYLFYRKPPWGLLFSIQTSPGVCSDCTQLPPWAREGILLISLGLRHSLPYCSQLVKLGPWRGSKQRVVSEISVAKYESDIKTSAFEHWPDNELVLGAFTHTEKKWSLRPLWGWELGVAPLICLVPPEGCTPREEAD